MLSFLKVRTSENESVMVRTKKKKVFPVFVVSFFMKNWVRATFVAALPYYALLFLNEI